MNKATCYRFEFYTGQNMRFSNNCSVSKCVGLANRFNKPVGCMFTEIERKKLFVTAFIHTYIHTYMHSHPFSCWCSQSELNVYVCNKAVPVCMYAAFKLPEYIC